MQDSLLLCRRLCLYTNKQTNIVVMEMIDVISDANKHLGDAGDPSVSLNVLMCAFLVESTRSVFQLRVLRSPLDV